MTLFAVLACVNFASCNSDENEELQEPKKITVSLGFGGEFHVSESPLSRTTNDDLYYVVVGTSNSSSIYAYGLFDDIDKINISLTEGKTYSFLALIMKGAKEQLKHTDYLYQDLPFIFDVELNNKFITSDDEAFSATGKTMNSCMGPGFTDSQGNTYHYYTYDNIDFYFPNGITECTVEEDTQIKINMKRMVFGANFIAKDLTSGTLEIDMKKTITNPNLELVSPTIELNTSKTSSDEVYAFIPLGSLSEIVDGDYAPQIPISFIWKKAGETEGTLLGTPTITFKRNMKTTINVKVAKDLNNGFGFTYYDQSTTLGDGGTYNVDGDNATKE